MRRAILYVLAFAVVNGALLLVHIRVFQSNFPFAAWATILAHAVGLIFFHYQKLFSK